MPVSHLESALCIPALCGFMYMTHSPNSKCSRTHSCPLILPYAVFPSVPVLNREMSVPACLISHGHMGLSPANLS
eukprot:362561-Alexandrium_andersonii.AAC.1